MNKGQSIVEVIIAVSILIIIASSAVIGILGSLSTSRLAKEETEAAFFANEAMEAMQSIRNQGFDNLVDGTYGLTDINGFWELSGTSDTDPSGKYTREVIIETINRDINGDIAPVSGNEDPDSKRITVNVNWDFTPTRNNTIELVTYLTNWQNAVDPGGAGPPPITTCTDYCRGLLYSSGACRRNPNECAGSGEVNEQGGDQFCTTNPNDTCCCQ